MCFLFVFVVSSLRCPSFWFFLLSSYLFLRSNTTHIFWQPFLDAKIVSDRIIEVVKNFEKVYIDDLLPLITSIFADFFLHHRRYILISILLFLLPLKKVNKGKVTAAARFKEDLDLDSLDAVEVVMAIEEGTLCTHSISQYTPCLLLCCYHNYLFYCRPHPSHIQIQFTCPILLILLISSSSCFHLFPPITHLQCLRIYLIGLYKYWTGPMQWFDSTRPEEFSIEIPDSEADKILSIADAVAYVSGHPMAK